MRSITKADTREAFVIWLERMINLGPDRHYSTGKEIRYRLTIEKANWSEPTSADNRRYFLECSNTVDYDGDRPDEVSLPVYIGQLLGMVWKVNDRYSWSDQPRYVGFVTARTILSRLRKARDDKEYLAKALKDQEQARKADDEQKRREHLERRRQRIRDKAIELVRAWDEDMDRHADMPSNHDALDWQSRTSSNGEVAFHEEQLTVLVGLALNGLKESDGGCTHCRGIGACNWKHCDRAQAQHPEWADKD